MNLLLIAVDTCRADHLGCYGYHRPTSPNLDRLAAEGVVFDRFLCAQVPTQPSYTSIFTGQFSIGHAGFMAVGAYTSAMLSLTGGQRVVTTLLAGASR